MRNSKLTLFRPPLNRKDEMTNKPMKKINHLILFVLLIFATTSVMAELKIGYVNAAKLLDEAPQAEAASQKLKSEFSARETNMLAMQQSLKELSEKFSRDALVMSVAEKKTTEAELLSKSRDLRRKQEDFRQEITVRRNEEIGGLQVLIRATIEEIGATGDFDLILYEGIAFVKPGMDITDQVLRKLNAAQ